MGLKTKGKAALLILAAIVLLAVLFFSALAQKPAKQGEVQFARVDDIKIAFKTFGEGEPVILIMGFSGTMDVWDEGFIKSLAARHKVIVFDNRGMGLTSSSSKNYTVETLGDDTAGLMDAIGVQRAHVVGWSMGTYIAQELALRHPEKVDKLVLYAADCGGKEAVMPSDEVLQKLGDTSGSPEERGKRTFGLLFPQEWLQENPDPGKFFPDVVETSSPESINRQNEAWMEWQGACSRLSRITQPTLLITGTDDILTPPENSRMMAKLLPNATLVEMPGGGHGLIFQNLGFAEKVIDFIKR
jgi:pimeloyl-ACP methyl ester carboxylesterase